MKKYVLLTCLLFSVLYGYPMKMLIPTTRRGERIRKYSISVFPQLKSAGLLGDTIVLGTTTYDWQSNGIGIRHIYYDSGILAGYELTGIVWIWSDSPGPSFVNRHMYYWSPWVGAGPVQNTYRDGFGMIDYKTTGDAIVSEHYNNGSYYCSAVGYEPFGPGFASFSISECPPPPDSIVVWPRVGVDAMDNVLVLSKTYQNGGYSRVFWTKTVWGNWATSDWSTWTLLDTCGYGIHNLVASKQSGKFAAAYEYSAISGESDPSRLARDGHLYVKVSTDGGATWQSPIDINQFLPPTDSLRCLRSPSPFFDDMDSLHLVFIGAAPSGSPGTWIPSSAVKLWHWSWNTGLTKITDYGWTPYNVIGIDWNKIENTYYLDIPSIGENTDTKDLFVVYHTFPWDECDPVDSAQTGEIYIVRSRDNGITWGQPVNLTNSPNHSEVFPSIPLFFQGDTVRISYLDDVYGGSYVFGSMGYGVDTIMADNPYVYMKVPIPPDGDVGVASIIEPAPGESITPLEDTITPKAVIENYSSIEIPAQVKCMIYVNENPGYGYDEVYTDLIYDTLPPLSQDTVVFNQWVPDTFYGVDSTCYTVVSVAYLGDINYSNDTLTSNSKMVDNTPPDAPANLTANGSNPSPWSNNSQFVLNWSNPSDASGIAKGLYKLGSAPASDYDTTGSMSPSPPCTLAITTEGITPLYLWLVDNSGNVDYNNNSSVSLRYDTTKPSIPSPILPDSGSILNDSNVTFCWSRSNDTLSGIHHYTLQYALDSNFTQGLVETTAADTLFTGVLSDTIYYWRVKAVDAATNEGTFSTTWQFELDTQSPNAPILNSPVGGIWLSDTNVTFKWSAVTFDIRSKSPTLSSAVKLDITKRLFPKSEKNQDLFINATEQPERIPLSPVRYILQVDTTTGFSSPIFIDTLTSTSTSITLNEAFYYWCVKAYDLAGNQGPYAQADSFGVDATLPVIESTTIWTDTSYTGGFEITTKIIDNLSGVDSVLLYYKREEDTDWIMKTMHTSGNWFTDTIPAVSNFDDTVKYYISAVDKASNISTDPAGAPSLYYSFVGNYTGIQEESTKPHKFSFEMRNTLSIGKVVFNLALPKADDITLYIYDITGRLVDMPINERKQAGIYSISWGSKSSAGVYFYRLNSSLGKKTGKFIFLK